MTGHEESGGWGARGGHLRCPFCASYDVSRMYIGSRAVDCCDCMVCGSAWEESAETGVYRGRASSTSVIIPGN